MSDLIFLNVSGIFRSFFPPSTFSRGGGGGDTAFLGNNICDTGTCCPVSRFLLASLYLVCLASILSGLGPRRCTSVFGYARISSCFHEPPRIADRWGYSGIGV